MTINEPKLQFFSQNLLQTIRKFISIQYKYKQNFLNLFIQQIYFFVSQEPLNDFDTGELQEMLCVTLRWRGWRQVQCCLSMTAADCCIKALPSSSNRPTGLPAKSPSLGHSYAFSSHRILWKRRLLLSMRASHAHIGLNTVTRSQRMHSQTQTTLAFITDKSLDCIKFWLWVCGCWQRTGPVMIVFPGIHTELSPEEPH